MSNLKWGLLAATAALLISVTLGLISGVSLFHVFVRAGVFAVAFLGLGFGLKLIINTFFPELLFTDNEPDGLDNFNVSQSRVIIAQDTTGEYAVPELYKTPGDPDELGNIEDLISGAFRPREVETPVQQTIDQKREEGYNDLGDFLDVPELESLKFQSADVNENLQAKKPEFVPEFGDNSNSLGGLPDLDAMAMAFGIGSSGESQQAAFSGNNQVESFDFNSSSGFGDISVDSFTGSTGSSSSEELESGQSSYVGNKPQPLKGDFNPKELAEGIRTVLSKDNK